MKEKLEKFILANKLTFEKGMRNTHCVIICGYAQYLGDENFDILNEILKPYFDKDHQLEDEFIRVWQYTDDNNYSDWWNTPSNRNEYIL